MQLPEDLRAFLTAGLSLDYDDASCEAGQVVLLPPDRVRVELFPTDVDNGHIDNSADPHQGQMGCYLVPAVSLLAECDNYDPHGLLLWIPDEQRYGTWDSSHTLILVLPPTVSWTDIAADPVRYINSFWGDDDEGLATPLVPWPKYSYDPAQPHWPKSTSSDLAD